MESVKTQQVGFLPDSLSAHEKESVCVLCRCVRVHGGCTGAGKELQATGEGKDTHSYPRPAAPGN